MFVTSVRVFTFGLNLQASEFARSLIFFKSASILSFLKKIKKSVRPHILGLKLWLFRIIGPMRGFKVEDSLIISSETRGGSTWLMELINTDPDTIINWEPLHEIKGVVPPAFRWGPNPSIPENTRNTGYEDLMKKMLTYKLATYNSIKYCTLKELLNGKRVITKFVRSNEMLAWLVNSFQLKYKPIYLLRHPVAVAKSQIRNFYDKHEKLSPFEILDTINSSRYLEHLGYINSLTTMLERQVALWCIHNRNVLNHPDHGKKWIVVYYENLVVNPDKELQRLAEELNLNIPDGSIDYQRASRSDYHNEYISDKSVQLSKWKNGLTDDQLRALQEVLDHFGIEEYSALDIYPIGQIVKA
jgi:hypothetical protein